MSKTIRANRDTSENYVEKTMWWRNNKKKLLAAGIGVPIITASCVCLLKTDSISAFWEEMKTTIKIGKPLSTRWLANADLSDIRKARDIVQDKYLHSLDDAEYRDLCYNVRRILDNAIRKRERTGNNYGFPVHREHGWYLPSDD